jgi:pSer/pThr/pTyr-binding forkhead associated (FHA) protein/outer membrane protein assembly factor BamB
MPRLVLQKRSEIISEYVLRRKPSITIGSAKGNDIVIPDKAVSEHHCTIARKGEGYELKDNNTVTGTRVNERTVNDKELSYGDEIGVGGYTLLYIPEEDGETQGYFLLGVYGKFEGKKYRVKDGDTYIGREKTSPRGIENDVVLAGDMTASKGHAKINCRGQQCLLTDIGSTGGVAVNGNKVGQLNDVAVAPGDEIAIGRTIFRFIKGEEDYAVPRHHNIFLLKVRKPFLFSVSLIALIAGTFLFFQGMSGVRTATSTPKKLEMDLSKTWSPYNNLVKSDSPEYDISSSPAIGDFNNDGTNDIAYLSSSGFLYAWDGKSGEQLWKPVEIYNSGKSSPALGDMNNDGILDLLAISDASILIIVDGQTGNIIRREALGGAIAELSPAVADLNGDGKLDVVACSEEGMVHFVYSPGYDQRIEKFTEFVEGPVYASPIVVSSKKLSPLAVVATNASKVYFFDGKSRSKRAIDLVEKTGKAHLIAGSPAAGDLNGDGIPDIVVQSNVPQYISAIDLNHFEVSWTYFVEPIPPAGLKHNASPVIADMNGDGMNDVAALSANGVLYALKGKTGYPTGELLWKVDVPGGGRLIASPALYDFDRDGLMEIIFGTEDGSIAVGKSVTRRKEMEILASARASNGAITSSVVIADIKGAGKVNIAFSSMLNAVQYLETNVSTFRGKKIWPMYLGSAARSGSDSAREAALPFAVRMAIGILLWIAVFGVKISRIRHKLSKRPRTAII